RSDVAVPKYRCFGCSGFQRGGGGGVVRPFRQRADSELGVRGVQVDQKARKDVGPYQTVLVDGGGLFQHMADATLTFTAGNANRVCVADVAGCASRIADSLYLVLHDALDAGLLGNLSIHQDSARAGVKQKLRRGSVQLDPQPVSSNV